MKNFLNPDIEIKNIFNIVYVKPGTGKPKHFNREFHGLCYYPSADSIFEFNDNTSVKTKHNSIIYLPEKSTYTVRNIDASHTSRGCYAINFRLAENTVFKPFCISIKNNIQAEKLFVSAEKVWREKSVGYSIKCKSILYDILYLMQKQVYNEYMPSSKKMKLTPAMDYIHSRYLDEEIRISYLAEICNMSETYFRKLFAENFHSSPIKYINALKIAHARELLQSGMYNSVGIISQLSGFSDENYFRKIFKQITSMSPTEYRKRL